MIDTTSKDNFLTEIIDDLNVLVKICNSEEEHEFKRLIIKHKQRYEELLITYQNKLKLID